MASHHQDWDRVVLHKSKKGGGGGGGGGGGSGTSTGPTSGVVSKYGGGSNAKGSDKNMAKLDRDTENVAHQTVPLSLSKAIMKARTEKKMSQADLANKIRTNKAVIRDYEAGKAIPDNNIIAKIERALDTKLPRPKKKK